MKEPGEIKNDFELNDSIYLLNHSAGRPLKDSEVNLSRSFFSAWKTNEPWQQWLPAITGFQENLGELLDTDPQNICPQTNVSSAFTKILFSLPKRPGKQHILLSEYDFPSIGFVALQAARAGYELKFLEASADHTNPEIWQEAITEDVQWVMITQAQSNTGVATPVKEIINAAHRIGAIAVVDVAQSIGVLPVNLKEWNADFVIGSCLKWLCGGPGAGFLYVNPSIAPSCQPVDVGWFSHENPFEFDIRHFNYNPGAWRFFGGTPSVVPFVLAAHSIGYLNKIGYGVIRKHNLEMTQKIIDSTEPQCLISPAPPEKRSGTLILHFGEQHQDVVERLNSHNVAFDSRAFGIRLSPHIYNTSEEMDRVIACFNQ